MVIYNLCIYIYIYVSLNIYICVLLVNLLTSIYEEGRGRGTRQGHKCPHVSANDQSNVRHKAIEMQIKPLLAPNYSNFEDEEGVLRH